MRNEFSSLSQEMILKSLDWAYDKAVNGVTGLDSAQDMANDYMCKDGSLVDKVNSLIGGKTQKQVRVDLLRD